MMRGMEAYNAARVRSESVMKKGIFAAITVSFGYLLLCPREAAEAARSGLLLWYHSVIPVLLPFMLLCNLFLRCAGDGGLRGVPAAPLGRLFGCSAAGGFAVFAGFLCGFPMGAKVTSDLLHAGRIDRRESRHLYGFVNNLSPGFILSYLSVEQMGTPQLRFAFLATILGSAMLYGIVTSPDLRRVRRGRRSRAGGQRPFRSAAAGEIAHGASGSASGPESAGQTAMPFLAAVDESIYDAALGSVRLGALIMAFCILADAALRFLPVEQAPVLFGVACIEVTNGIRLIASSALPFELKYVLVNALGAFGGVSALAQTAGIAGFDAQDFLQYIKSRAIITLLSVLLSVFTIWITSRLC